MQTVTKNFIRLVRDEADALRQNKFFVEELSVYELEKDNSQNSHRWMTRLHYPITKLGIKLNDQQRHDLFSAIFHRRINSTKELTDIEIEALNRIAELDPKDYGVVILDIINDQS